MSLFPGALDTDAQLKVAADNISAVLASAMLSTDTSINVVSAAGIPAFSIVTIDNEQISIWSVAGNVLTVGDTSGPSLSGRGFNGTAAAAHAIGAALALNIDAYHHQSMTAAIKAIEGALGANLSNLPAPPAYPVPVNLGGTGVATLTGILQGNGAAAVTGLTAGLELQYLRRRPNAGATPVYEFANSAGNAAASDYNFPAQTPGGALAAGANTITLFPMPAGITAASIGVAVLYVANGAGSAEAVPIIGWSATTVTVTCANTHSGAWTIQSASSGLQEALIALGASGVVTFSPAAPCTLHGQVTVPAGAFTLNGQSSSVNAYSLIRAQDYPSGDLILNPSAVCQFLNIAVSNETTAAQASGFAFHNVAGVPEFDNVFVDGGYGGFRTDGGQFTAMNATYSSTSAHAVYGALFTGANNDTEWIGGRIYMPITGTSIGLAIHGGDTFKFSNITFSGAQFQTDIQNLTGYIANVWIDHCAYDTGIFEAIRIGQPNAGLGCGNIRISNCMINGEQNTATGSGIDIGNSVPSTAITNVIISGCEISEWGGNGIFAAASVSPLLLSHNIVQANNYAHASVDFGGVVTGASGAVITGNSIRGGTFQYYGVIFFGAAAGVTIMGNDLSGNATGPVVLYPGATLPTALILVGNRGIDDVEGTVADAAALAIPFNPISTLTGTGVPITSLTNIWPGRKGTLIPLGATPTFTAGATIGANYVGAINVPIDYTVDSAGKAWLK